jgi:hypothetical protein
MMQLYRSIKSLRKLARSKEPAVFETEICLAS